MVKYCAPALAGLKAGNLFAYPFSPPEETALSIQKMNRLLGKKGVSLEILKFGQLSSLIYVYREKLLESYLRDGGAAGFLERYGYKGGGAADYIDVLKKRLLQNEGFPHEIGVFLGYPVEDVAAFIEHKGQNFRLTGFWKVYFNEACAVRIFTQYAECIAQSLRLYQKGCSVKQIAAQL